MTKQYLRDYSLTISDESTTKTIRGLRIAFEVTKSVQSTPNLCKLVIYNPNQQTKSILQKRLSRIVLTAGFVDSIRLIFTGRVRNSTLTAGADELLTVYAGDGQRDWESAHFNKTFSPNTNIDNVIKQLAGTFTETSSVKILDFERIKDMIRGQSLSGMTKDILDTFAKNYGFQWSIQDGVFEVVGNDKADTRPGVMIVNATTGMIGEPTVTEIGADVRLLLNSGAKPNALFRIESIGAGIQQGNLFFAQHRRTRAEGTYKILEVVHRGDTHDKQWTSDLKGVYYNANR